jgi:hypothetical protein
MSSLSLSRIPRPYQFALLAVLLVAALWFLVVQKMVSSSSSETTSPALHAPTNVHRAPGATTAHHPAALTPAHPAGKTAKPASATASHSAAATSKHAAAASHPVVRTTHVVVTPKRTTPPSGAGKQTTVVKEIESELGENKVVLALFWNPAAHLDQYVRGQLKLAGQISSGTVSVHYAQASQVAEFGKYTQKVLINETPTILLITPGGQVTTLAGFNEVKSIEQAISEVANPFAAVPESALFAYRQKVAKVCAPVQARMRNFLPTAFNPHSSEKSVQSALHVMLAEEARLIATLRTMSTPAGTDRVLFAKDVAAAEHMFAQLRSILTGMVGAVRQHNSAALASDISQLTQVSGGGYEVVAAVCPVA